MVYKDLHKTCMQVSFNSCLHLSILSMHLAFIHFINFCIFNNFLFRKEHMIPIVVFKKIAASFRRVSTLVLPQKVK